MSESQEQVTRLLKLLGRGDASAANRLMPLVFDKLRQLARHYMRGERIGHTLQPTALVSEAYIKLAGMNRMNWQSRSHFIGVAAQAMRQILVDYARKKRSTKRGSGQAHISILDEKDSLSSAQSREIVALDDALKTLERLSPRQVRVVEMRYFGGLSVEETAMALGVSPITVKREWAMARAWLQREIRG